MKTARGFTIIELAITLAVAAVMTSVAVPNFRSLIQNSRVRSQADELFTSLHLARSSALKQQVDVYLSPNSGELSAGWTVWADTNDDGVQQTSEPLLAQTDALLGGTTIDPIPAITSGSPVFFRADGTVNTTRVFELRIPGCSSDQARDISVSPIGKVSVAPIDC